MPNLGLSFTELNISCLQVRVLWLVELFAEFEFLFEYRQIWSAHGQLLNVLLRNLRLNPRHHVWLHLWDLRQILIAWASGLGIAECWFFVECYFVWLFRHSVFGVRLVSRACVFVLFNFRREAVRFGQVFIHTQISQSSGLWLVVSELLVHLGDFCLKTLKLGVDRQNAVEHRLIQINHL